MYRYKLLLKNNWLLITLTVIAIITLVVWYDNFIWILNQTKGLK